MLTQRQKEFLELSTYDRRAALARMITGCRPHTNKLFHGHLPTLFTAVYVDEFIGNLDDTPGGTLSGTRGLFVSNRALQFNSAHRHLAYYYVCRESRRDWYGKVIGMMFTDLYMPERFMKDARTADGKVAFPLSEWTEFSELASPNVRRRIGSPLHLVKRPAVVV